MKRNVLLTLIAGFLALTLIAVIGLFAILAFALPSLQASIASAASQPSTVLPSTSVLPAPRLSTLTDLESAYENIYNQVNPSVVLIETVSNTGSGLPGNHPTVPNTPGGGDQALGSGFIWDTQGNIVTNNHVIDGADTITVTFSDGTVVPAKVVAADVDSDLAVIKVTAPANLLKPIQMGDSRQLKVGQVTIAIGNPYGEQNTMTTGIVSAIGRSLPVGGGDPTQGPVSGPTYSIPDVIQTDASINPGNSGGVLLNAQGQVIGVTQSIESASGASAGIGFAIPSTIVQRVVPALIKNGKYDHPYLGISGGSLTPSLAQAMGLKPEQRGALVATTTANGPSAKAGLKGSTKPATVDGIQTQVGGDVITAFNGQPVKSFDDLVAFLARTGEPNQTVTLTILRDGKEQTVQVTLGARPSSQTNQ